MFFLYLSTYVKKKKMKQINKNNYIHITTLDCRRMIFFLLYPLMMHNVIVVNQCFNNNYFYRVQKKKI